MIELKYKSWNDITVNVYEKIDNAINSITQTDDEDLNMLNTNIAILSVLTECDEEEIANLNYNEFGRLVNEILFLKQLPQPKLKLKYNLGGNIYEVKPDIANMNMAQLIDFKTLIKDKQKNFKQLLACFLLPKKCKKYGDGYDIKNVVDDIGNYLSMPDANCIMFFFVQLYKSYLIAIHNYSIRTLKKEMKKEKEMERKQIIQNSIAMIEKEVMNLEKSGGGFIL